LVEPPGVLVLEYRALLKRRQIERDQPPRIVLLPEVQRQPGYSKADLWRPIKGVEVTPPLQRAPQRSVS